MFKRFFRKKSEQAEEAWYEEKSKLMEQWLGPEHDMVMHALIPFAVGGGLDLYYYPKSTPGTGIATKELTERPGKGPCNQAFKSYELVMYTSELINLDDSANPETPFGRAHQTMNAVLNAMAPYCLQATLNPGDTCEFPADFEKIGGRCLVLDVYPDTEINSASRFGLMLIMEVHRSEMEFARAQSGAELIGKLKQAGHYPYSDMNRPAVV